MDSPFYLVLKISITDGCLCGLMIVLISLTIVDQACKFSPETGIVAGDGTDTEVPELMLSEVRYVISAMKLHVHYLPMKIFSENTSFLEVSFASLIKIL